MPKRIGFVLVLCLAALAFAVSGCGGDDEEPAAGTTATTVPEEPGAPPVTVELSEQSGSGQTGTAALEAIDDSTTRVTIELGSPPAEPQPAHIHSGTCAELGDVVHPLTNLEGGSSEAEVAAPIADLQTGSFAINVHASEADIGTYVACGDIPATS